LTAARGLGTRFGLGRPGLGLVIALAGLVARAGLMTPWSARPPEDPDNYLVLAEALANGEGYRIQGRPTAYRPPLYPVLLAPGVVLFGNPPLPWLAGLHLTAGGLTIALIGRAARAWGLSERARLLAMGVVAFDPVLIAQTRSVMTETTAALLVAALLASIPSRPTLRSACGTGFLAGLAGLCRPSLLAAPVLIAAADAIRGPEPWKARLLRNAALLAAVALTLAPWAARNASWFGEPVWTTTHGGHTLYLANNPAYYDDVIRGPREVWSGPNQAAWFHRVHRLGFGRQEPETDRILRRWAFETIRDRPGDFLRASLDRLGRFWAIAPSAAVYGAKVRALVALWTVPLWALLILGIVRSARRWPVLAALAVLVALSGVHTLFWTDVRMRAPVVPAIALIAASAVSSKRHKTSESS